LGWRWRAGDNTKRRNRPEGGHWREIGHTKLMYSTFFERKKKGKDANIHPPTMQKQYLNGGGKRPVKPEEIILKGYGVGDKISIINTCKLKGGRSFLKKEGMAEESERHNLVLERQPGGEGK